MGTERTPESRARLSRIFGMTIRAQGRVNRLIERAARVVPVPGVYKRSENRRREAETARLRARTDAIGARMARLTIAMQKECSRSSAPPSTASTPSST